MTLWRRLVLSALSGALLAFAFPKTGLAFLAFVALVPLLLALDGASRRLGFLCGQIAGTIQGFFLLSWVADLLHRHGGASLPLAFTLTFALALAFGLFLGAFGALQAHLGLALASRSLLLAPFLFVTCEYLREHLLFGFPWCLLGYSQVDFPELIQIASFTAVHGVSFLLAVSSAGLAHLFLARSSFERRLGMTLPALLVSGAMAFGHGRLQKPLMQDGPLTVGIIQASIPQDQKWEPALLQSNLDRHLALSREAARRQASLVVWPESAVGYELDLYPEVKRQIDEFVSKESVFLLTGNDDRERAPSGEVLSYVGAKLITPAGGISMRYRKMRLVPFGEYLPLSSWLGSFLPVRRLVESVSDFHPGDESRDRRGSRRFGRRLHLLRGDLPRPGAEVRSRGGAGPGECDQRRLVRDERRPLPALRHGQVSRGRESPVPGSRRQHRDLRDHRPVRPGASPQRVDGAERPGGRGPRDLGTDLLCPPRGRIRVVRSRRRGARLPGRRVRAAPRVE